MNSLSGSVAIVTGASRGFGREIAKQLAAEGIRVVAAARSGAELDSLVTEIRAAGGVAVARVTDVADPGQCKHLVESTSTELGGPQILINNAGLGYWEPIESITDDHWIETVNVNLNAMFYLTRAAIPHMRQAGWGHVVNFASTLATRTQPNVAPYAATKAGIRLFSDVLSREVKEYGIKVTVILPGTGDTAFRDRWVGRPYEPELHDPDRMLQPADMAETVLFALRASKHVASFEVTVEPLRK